MKKFFKVIVPILMALLILASLVWYGFVYDRDFTRDILLKQARYWSTHGQVKLSSWFYDLAYEHSGQSNNVAIELANQFKKSGNYTKAEATLHSAIADGGTLDLYSAMCKLYVEQDKIIDAINMLDYLTDNQIIMEIEQARPAAPVADLEPGFYNEYLSVQLSSDEGTIYYILNETYPSFQSAPYNEPITLPAGETTINAIVVSPSGLVSPISSFTYTIGGIVEQVTFEDSVIERAVRDQLKLGGSAIYTNQLWEISSFEVPEGASNLNDLSKFTHLNQLTIADYDLASLDFLQNMTSLTHLNMSGSWFPADGLNTIASLPQLKILNLSNCGLSTLSGLENAMELTDLNLSGNSIRNLTPLSSLYHLQDLDLSHNAVTDLTSLSNLAYLNKLDLSYNAITSIAPIAPCYKLNWLNVNHNHLTSISALTNLTELTYLDVSNNELTDVSVIGECTNLQELNISNNAIVSIDSFKSLVNLMDFYFNNNEIENLPNWPVEECSLRKIDGSYNKLRNVKALSGINSLNIVNLDYNQITSVAPLANCHTLIQVNIFGNEIKDPEKLTELDIIINYDPTFSMADLG